MTAAIICAILSIGTPAKLPYSYDAVFIEGCSCQDVCVTEVTGTDAKCHGLAAMDFHRASYAGKDFSGSRAAWAWGPGWVHLYVDAKSPRRDGLVKFLKAALSDWGTMENVTLAKVAVDKYSASVADGKMASITIAPVLGGDGKTPVEHTNLGSLFHDRLNQGKIKTAWYKEPGHEADWNGTNAFFNAHCRMSGKV